MKNLAIFISMLIGISFMNAQKKSKGTDWIKLGLHAGIPVNDAKETSTFALGIDAKYQLLNLRSFGIGASTGYTHYFEKDNYDSTGVLPIALLLRYYMTKNFFFGTDLGYGFLFGNESDKRNSNGGFYYRPEIGYHSNEWNIYGYYAGITGDYTPSNVGIGINYNLIQGRRR